MSKTMKSAVHAKPSKAYENLVLNLLPDHGEWTEDDYLWLTDHTSQLVEFTDGYLEALPTPSERHQAMVEFLFLAFRAFVMASGGKVRFAPLRLRIRSGKFREPDLLLLKSSDDPRRQDRFWTGADLAVEVVSATKPERDLVAKKHDYAEGGVPEYWIVNPSTETITVLTLNGKRYRTHSVYKRGQRAESVALHGFTVSVDESFDAD